MGEPMSTRRLRSENNRYVLRQGTVSRTLLLGTLLIGLLSTVETVPAGAQRGAPADSAIVPYPRSVPFCQQHVTGAPGNDGKAGPHINWSGYYSTDSQEAVVSHYMKALGSENHQKEDSASVWRFPQMNSERVLTVTTPKGSFPREGCKALPKAVRTIIIISMMTRPD